MANRISSSKNEIYTKLLDIAGKYTDIKDSDFLKTGLFGYITESMAMAIRDSAFHKSMIYNESTLNTAIIPKTVYNWAKMFNVEVQKATPAYANISIIIPTSSLDTYLEPKATETIITRYGIPSTTTNFLILNKEDPILAGDYYFSLEHSILLKKDNSNKYSAEYITTEYISTQYQTNIPLKLEVKKVMSDDNLTENLVISARAYQYRKTEFKRQISSNSFLNKVQKFDFEDQFCGAKLFYKENNVDKEILLQYSDLSVDVENTAFYNLSSENELEIIFKNGKNTFLPSSNTLLRVLIYSTKGANVPNKYSSDALMLISDTKLKSLPVVIQFESSIFSGTSMPSLTDIKQTIIDEISTRKTITTKSDLNAYFKILTSIIEDINNGKITFIKKRDDILKRVYNTYLLLRDSVEDTDDIGNNLSHCVPTNTLDVYFSNSDSNSDSSQSSLPPPSPIELDYPKFKGQNKDNIYKYIETSDNDNYDFVCPFCVYIQDSKHKSNDNLNIVFVKYIYNMTDSSSTLSYYNNKNETEATLSNEYSMIPKMVYLKRGFNDKYFSAEDKYQILLTFNTNFSLGSESDSKTLKSDAKIKINNNLEVPISQATSEKLDDGSYLTTLSVYLYAAGNNEFRDSYSKILLGKGKNEDGKLNDPVSFSDKERLTFSFDSFIGGFTPEFSFISDNKLVFFQNLDDIMESSVITKTETKTEDGKEKTDIRVIGIKELPLVSRSFMNDSTNSKDANNKKRKEGFVKELFTYINILKENNSKLETSTFFNLKFYNTYGHSQLYNTSRTDLKLELYIVMADEYKTNDILKENIKAYTRKIVDQMNESQQFNISTIIKLLTDDSTYGNYISHIEFRGLNNTFNQTINSLSDVDADDYTPEWLNITLQNDQYINFDVAINN